MRPSYRPRKKKDSRENDNGQGKKLKIEEQKKENTLSKKKVTKEVILKKK